MTDINLEMLELTKKLVQIPSVNTTSGEKNIAIYIENYIRKIPYFERHPEQVVIQPLKDDALDRRNVFALLKGERKPKPDTILLHGHIDTVGVEDYGALRESAFFPDDLKKKMQQMKVSEEVKEDLLSGDYLFGRGACDMKSGDAVFLVLLKELSEKVDELDGNILVSFNPVEENLHTGIIEGLDILQELKNKYRLEYRLAINNDFICPLFPGDEMKTIYTGTVGKLLPCFYIQGKETHVGQCFEGFDAAMMAAKLVDKIHLNCDFSDGYSGEYSYPPSVLKMKDLKPWYNVQTVKESIVYFNYFVHNASMEEITEKLLNAAKEAMKETCDVISAQNKRFNKYSGQSGSCPAYQIQVVTYDELVNLAKKSGKPIEEYLRKEAEKAIEKGTDKREVPVSMIRCLLWAAEITTPIIVLYYAPPYCPHNTLQGKEEDMIKEISDIASVIEQKFGVKYRMMKFFPSLSDSSYIKIDDSEESVDMLVRNFPAIDLLYPIPIREIQKINIPAINYGCYGKDAHKWTERVNISYTFSILPELIEETINYYLK